MQPQQAPTASSQAQQQINHSMMHHPQQHRQEPSRQSQPQPAMMNPQLFQTQDNPSKWEQQQLMYGGKKKEELRGGLSFEGDKGYKQMSIIGKYNNTQQIVLK